MTLQTLKSNVARLKWRDLLNAARAGSDTVIVHYDEPVGAFIPYADFLAVQDELDDLRLARRAAVAYEAWKRDPSLGTPLAQVEAELRAEGLLDA